MKWVYAAAGIGFAGVVINSYPVAIAIEAPQEAVPWHHAESHVGLAELKGVHHRINLWPSGEGRGALQKNKQGGQRAKLC